MKITGKLVAVRPSLDKNGKQRTFATQDGKSFECWEADVDHPTVATSGKEYTEQFVAEFNREVNPQNVEPYKNYVGNGVVYDINIYFSRREYQGKFFQTIRLGQISQKMM